MMGRLQGLKKMEEDTIYFTPKDYDFFTVKRDVEIILDDNVTKKTGKYFIIGCGLCFMVFDTIINNMSVISWWSVLLVEETGVPGENHRPVASH